MLHAFRIGPLEAPDGSTFLYAARLPTGELEATQAEDDIEGLRQLLDALEGQPLVVEPALAKAGKQLGLRRARLPPEDAHEKAAMALALMLRMNELIGPKVAPSLVGDLLDAAAAFAEAAPWRFVDGDTPLQVEVLEGKRRRILDGALMGQAGQEFGFVLYPQPGALQRLLAAGDPEKAAARVELLAVSLEDEPAWVVAAVKQAMGVAVVPIPMHVKNKRPRPLKPEEVAMLAAVLRAGSEIGPSTREARSTSITEPRVEVVVHVPEAAPPPPPFEIEGPRPKVGRNAPCPCGSGRKYKRCCLPKHEAAERAQSRRPRLPDGLDPDVRLVFEIITFADARVPGWRDALPPAWEALRELPSGEQLLTPLLAYQYPLGPGITAASSWADDRLASCDLETREIFERDRAALLSVWEVLEVQPEVGLELVDLLTGEQRFVHEVSATRGLRVRDALLARVITRGGRWVLAGLHPRALPPAAAHDVVTAILRRLQLTVAPIPSARLGDPRTVEALLEQWNAAGDRIAEQVPVERELQNTDGEPFVPHEDRFALARGSKRKDVAAALLTLPGTLLDEEGRSTTRITLTKPGNAMHPHWRCTVIGSVAIDRRQLVLETNSRARADALRARIEQVLGAREEHRERTHGAAKTMRVPADTGPIALDATTFGGIWQPPQELFLREEARQYMERPLETLGGLTPREAASKAESRRALHQLLKEHEHGSAPGQGMAAFVREALELSATGELAPADEQTRRTGRGRKVSETLLDFAMPLLETVDDVSQLRPALELAAMVWNVDVLEDGEEGSDAFEAMQALAARAGLEEGAEWLERLRARRRLFAEDERIIDVLEVRWEREQIGVKALARIGPARPRKHGGGQLALFE